MATMAFNKFFYDNLPADSEYTDIYYKALERGAMFDARCFNIPKEEVANLIYWRQLDATRNSIQMVGQAHYSHSELQNKTNSQIQDMLMADYNINWNDFPIDCKRGACCIRNYQICEPYGNRLVNPDIAEGAWFIDREIPIFKGEDREYIERWIFIGEE
jgi:tRNA(His) 5'-end guanylyltransferase